ncbi:MAG: DMT family transporter [Chloroflexi bacterium]|nr:DMT family transporter [Chloroflexota bacterium]
MLPAFLTTVLFAISAVSANRTTRILGGIEANFWRILVATLFLGLWAHTAGIGLSGAAFPVFLLSGCVGFGVGDLALYQTFPRLGSRLSIMLVHCLAAPIAALAEWLWLGTTLSVNQILCSLTILAGVSTALAPSEHLRMPTEILLAGILFGTLAAGGQGFGAVLSRKAYEVAHQHGQSIDGMTAAYQRILGGVAVAVISLVCMRKRPETTRPDAAPRPGRRPPILNLHNLRPAWRWVLLNGLAGPALGVSCYQWALATTPTGIVLPIVALTPLVIIPFARVVEGERPSVRSLVGGIIAVAGVIGLTLAK